MASVDIYTSAFCGYCARAKALLDRKRVAYRELDVTMDAVLREEMAARAGGRRTVPQIFIGAAHVGGSDDLAALEASGKLDAMLAG